MSYRTLAAPARSPSRRILDAPRVAALASLLTAGGLLGLAGCENADGRIGLSGEVTFEGSPLEHGTIQFAATDGSSMTGGDVVDGTFDIPAERGVKPGEYLVRISSAGEGDAPVEAMPGDAPAPPVHPERIPAAWNTASEVTKEISADGENRFTFEIP